MANTITGRIYRISPTETKTFNDRTICERTLTVDATRRDQYTGEEMFPNFPTFNVSGEERCAALDSMKTGDIVTVSFELRGVKYADKTTGEEKFFTRTQAYKIEPYRRQQHSSPAQTGDLPPLPTKEPDFIPEPVNSDPF